MPNMRRIYLIGSLRNPEVPKTSQLLRSAGHYVFDEWYSPGPQADEYWQAYEQQRGLRYVEALNEPHAWNVLNFDKRNLDQCDTAVLLLPAGKSGHMELGYMVGCGKRTYIVLNGEPERWDVMYRFATQCVYDVHSLLEVLAKCN
jgi:nucleoside 2-deoxyribosyltransferase